MNEKSNNNLISNENSDVRSVKEAIKATDGSQGLPDVNQTTPRSTYELFYWLFSYTKMFAARLTKDIFISILGYFYSGQLLPNHIVHLMDVQKNYFTESESQTVTYSREQLSGSFRLTLIESYNAFKSYILSSEDDIELKCSTSKEFANSNVKSDPMFILVDSSCLSNSSCQEEMLNDKRPNLNKCILKKYINKNNPSIDMPSTSKYCSNDNTAIQLKESESMDDVIHVEASLQNEDVIPFNEDNENESIVISYLRNRDTLCIEELSETSLDVHIPSYPGSPRSLHVGSRYSLLSFDERHPKLKRAVDFLHSDNDFLVAAEIGDDKLLEIILSKGPNLQQTDYLGRNALHLAMCSDSERAIILLLKAGVNPNVKDNVGMTPLSLCIMRSPSIKVVNLLFNYGAVILPRSSPTDSGLFLQFIMMCIPTEEEENIIQLLVKKGALVNDPEAPAQRQALHFAAMSNNCHLIKILVNLGADLYQVNHRNETAREVAISFRCKEALLLLEEMEERTDIMLTSHKILSCNAFRRE